MIAIVVSHSLNRTIGLNNRIPWVVRQDLIRLKSLTLDQVVILGRASYESMVWYYDKSGRPMPGRLYLVMTRDTAYRPARDNAMAVHSVEEALAAVKQHGNDAYVIGGARVYAQLLPFTDTIYLTQIEAEISGDTFFPQLDQAEWQETQREPYKKDEKNEYDYTFITLKRI